MLIFTRRPGQTIRIGADIIVLLQRVQGQGVRVGVIAPPRVPIMRGELCPDRAPLQQPREH